MTIFLPEDFFYPKVTLLFIKPQVGAEIFFWDENAIIHLLALQVENIQTCM